MLVSIPADDFKTCRNLIYCLVTHSDVNHTQERRFWLNEKRNEKVSLDTLFALNFNTKLHLQTNWTLERLWSDFSNSLCISLWLKEELCRFHSVWFPWEWENLGLIHEFSFMIRKETAWEIKAKKGSAVSVDQHDFGHKQTLDQEWVQVFCSLHVMLVVL